MFNQFIRVFIAIAGAAVMIAALGCTATTQTVVYHNPLNRGAERNLLADSSLLNPGAERHPNIIDLRNWYTSDSLSGADTLRFLESYPRSDVDTIYHPDEYVAAAHPIYHLSGSEDGRIEKVFLSDDSTYVIEPMAYFINRYQMDFMIPWKNDVGFKAATIQLSWVDSLARKRVIDHTPEAQQLIRYALLGGLMMFLIIGSQNGLL